MEACKCSGKLIAFHAYHLYSSHLIRYPCYSLADVKAIVNTANHHSTGGDVSVCFSGDSKKLVSVGTVDGSSFVWSIEATK